MHLFFSARRKEERLEFSQNDAFLKAMSMRQCVMSYSGEYANDALDGERREKSSRESANGALNTDWHPKRYIMKLLSTLEYTRAQ